LDTALTYRLVLNIAILAWCKVVHCNVCGPMNFILHQKCTAYLWNYLDIESFILIPHFIRKINIGVTLLLDIITIFKIIKDQFVMKL
jgi:hypothetical protein